MKILLIPLDYQLNKTDELVFDGMDDGFITNGHEAIIYDGNLDNAIKFKPDLIILQGSISPEECKKLKYNTGSKVIMYTGDIRYAPMYSLIQFQTVVDMYFLPFSGRILESYSYLLGKPCSFLWEPIQNWRFKQLKPLDKGIISFVGNAYETVPCDRIRFVNFLHKHVPGFECYGSLPGSKGAIPTTEVPTLYQSSYCVIAENNWSEDSYFTPRNIGSMAASSCTLMRWFPNIEKFFTSWRDCVVYKNEFELLDIINFLRENPNKRNEIAKEGHKTAYVKYKYSDWAKQLIANI